MWPRLTPSSGISDSSTHSAAAQDGAVAAEHDHQLDAVRRGDRLGQRPHRVRRAGARAGRGPPRAARRRCRRRSAPRPAGSRRRWPPADPCGSARRPSGSLRVALWTRSPGTAYEVLLVAGRSGQPARHLGDDPPAVLGQRPRPTRSIAARCRAGSSTTPPLPSRSRPTSNCGLTSSSIRPSRIDHRGDRRDQRDQRDERDVGHHQVDRPAVDVIEGRGRGDVVCSCSRIRGSPRRLGCKLIGADVDRDHLGATAFEQHLGETAGRGAGVQGPTRDGQLERRPARRVSLYAARDT